MTPAKDRSHERLGGRYRLSRLLAEGGMGEVWRARDELLHRDVAVKLLRPSLATDAVVAERFRREARAAASMSHPNMANVFDFVEEDHRPGIVMELVDGETLADIIAREAPMDPERSVAIVDQVLDALAAAHAAGVVHRDVKPGNVIVDTNGQVRVTDFGIARAAGDSTLTDTGTVLGSVHYVSPEQLEGTPPDPSADLYATAVMLYEMLTGVRPFEAETPIATAMSRLTNDPEPARRHRPDLPPTLDAVILRAMSRAPAGRFASASDMRAALDAAVSGAPPAAWGDSTPAPVRPEPTLVMPAAELQPTEVIRREAPAKHRRRNRFFRPPWIWLWLAVVFWALIGLVASTRPTTARVPQLARMTLARAERIAAADGLTIGASDITRRHDGTIPKDSVISVTSPAPGVVVKRGTHIHVVVSDGPPPCCTVPSLLGKTLDEAQAALTTAGLTVGTVTYRAPAPGDQAGTVVDQNFAAGRTLNPGDQVDIVVASPGEQPRGHGKRGR